MRVLRRVRVLVLVDESLRLSKRFCEPSGIVQSFMSCSPLYTDSDSMCYLSMHAFISYRSNDTLTHLSCDENGLYVSPAESYSGSLSLDTLVGSVTSTVCNERL